MLSSGGDERVASLLSSFAVPLLGVVAERYSEDILVDRKEMEMVEVGD